MWKPSKPSTRTVMVGERRLEGSLATPDKATGRVRKIGVPYQRELAPGAIADGDEPEFVLNEDVVLLAGVGREYIEEEATKELAELEPRPRVYSTGGRARR